MLLKYKRAINVNKHKENSRLTRQFAHFVRTVILSIIKKEKMVSNRVFVSNVVGIIKISYTQGD